MSRNVKKLLNVICRNCEDRLLDPKNVAKGDWEGRKVSEYMKDVEEEIEEYDRAKKKEGLQRIIEEASDVMTTLGMLIQALEEREATRTGGREADEIDRLTVFEDSFCIVEKRGPYPDTKYFISCKHGGRASGKFKECRCLEDALERANHMSSTWRGQLLRGKCDCLQCRIRREVGE